MKPVLLAKDTVTAGPVTRFLFVLIILAGIASGTAAGQSKPQVFKTNGPNAEAMYGDSNLLLDLFIFTSSDGKIMVDYYLDYYPSGPFLHGFGEIPASDLVMRGKTMTLESDISRITNCDGFCGPATSGRIAAVWQKTTDWFRSSSGTQVYKVGNSASVTRTNGHNECSSAAGTVTILTETRPALSVDTLCTNHNTTLSIQHQ
jgi:hypothetical protein